MNTRKSLIASVLTATVIIAMAFLPQSIGAVKDRRILAEPAYADISAVQLQMDDSVLNQLLLLSSDMESYEISVSQAAISMSELPSILMDGLQPYINAGVLPFFLDFSTMEMHAVPYLCYDASAGENGGSVFWTVTLDFVDQGSIELLLDDYSRTILKLNCSGKDLFGKTGLVPDTLLRRYLDTYLAQLDTEDFDIEYLDYTTQKPLYHTAVILRHPDFAGYILIAFIADTYGVNMQIQSDHEVSAIKN